MSAGAMKPRDFKSGIPVICRVEQSLTLRCVENNETAIQCKMLGHRERCKMLGHREKARRVIGESEEDETGTGRSAKEQPEVGKTAQQQAHRNRGRQEVDREPAFQVAASARKPKSALGFQG
eukprot:5441998-Pleurochrysis_carterae.AAC.1